MLGRYGTVRGEMLSSPRSRPATYPMKSFVVEVMLIVAMLLSNAQFYVFQSQALA